MTRWTVGLAVALCAAGALIAAYLWRHWRRIMKGFVSALFGRVMSLPAAVLALATIIAVAAAPYLRTALSANGTPVNLEVVTAVVGHASVVLANSTPTYAAIGIYSAIDVQSMTEELVTLTRTIVASYLPADTDLNAADVDRLLGTVAAQLSARLSTA